MTYRTKAELETVVVLLIVSDMATAELIVAVVHQVPGIVRHLFYIRGSFTDGVFVETIERSLVDEIECGLGDIFQDKRGILDKDLAVFVLD